MITFELVLFSSLIFSPVSVSMSGWRNGPRVLKIICQASLTKVEGNAILDHRPVDTKSNRIISL